MTDDCNRAQVVVNFQLPPNIPTYERHEIDQIIEILQQTYRAISTKKSAGSKSTAFSESKIDELFDTMMLKKLQEQKEHLTIATVSEMRFVSLQGSLHNLQISEEFRFPIEILTLTNIWIFDQKLDF